jgi:cell division protein FtsB
MMDFVYTLSWRKAVWPSFLAGAFFYIAFHAISGEHGLYAWVKETHRLAALQAELATVSAERESVERKVRLLSNDSLDLDMLDEQARAVLGLAGADEVVVMVPSPALK